MGSLIPKGSAELRGVINHNETTRVAWWCSRAVSSKIWWEILQ